MIIGLIAIFCIIFVFDLPSLMKNNNKKKTIIVYFILLIAAFSISLLQILDKAPMSPSDFIENIVTSIKGGESF